MDNDGNIVVIGGGFAGMALARELDGKLPAGHQLILISEESYTTFNPMLPEALAASIFPEQVVAPVRALLKRGRFIMGRVTAVDAAARTLTCTSLAGDIQVRYEHLVFALGSRARLDLFPGLAEHALPLKTVGDAMHIRNIVLRRVAQIELESDASKRAALGHFVVIGGGFSGVEVAGELVDCLRSIRRYYPGVEIDELKVTLLHDQSRLLPEMSERLAAAARDSLAARGVDVRLETRAVEVGARHVALEHGASLSAATVICTIGTQPNALLAALPMKLERGRIDVLPDLSVRGAPRWWAAGDCAHVLNDYDGSVCPPTAQFAVRQARRLARNVLASLAGRPTTVFDYRPRGSMAAIGHLNGVAEIFGIPLTGLAAWLLWRAYYLSQMPTLGRKLRIFVEWTWGMFFPNDITHLRFTRSGQSIDANA
jgi:NADH dehydrogenase